MSHEWTVGPGLDAPPSRELPVDLAVDLAPTNPRELKLRNPIIPASGCFGYGEEYGGIIDVQRLGAFVSKGITPRRRKGNQMPRIVETPSGMLNAIGLQNPGIEGFVKRYPRLWQTWAVPAIVNICGESVDEYFDLARVLDEQPGVSALEVNISCPNIARGGYCFGWDVGMSAEVTRAVRAATTLPVIVKLSPEATDIVAVATAVEAAGADAISLINTLVGMSLDVRHRRPALAHQTGGLSGPAIRPLAVRMVYQVAAAVNLPVIGIGGIMSLRDALEFILAGASAVQIGTGIFVDPHLPIRLIDELEVWLEEEGFASIEQAVGIANPGFRPRIDRVLATRETAEA